MVEEEEEEEEEVSESGGWREKIKGFIFLFIISQGGHDKFMRFIFIRKSFF